MELEQIHDFLHNHIGAKWFDTDLPLYKKIFPQAKLIEQLEQCPEFKKSELDERMCAEMMMNGAVCDCSIWENRGYTLNKDGFIVPLLKNGENSEEELELLAIDLDAKQEYNTLKKLVFAFGLHTINNKEKTYINVLKAKKAEIKLAVVLEPELPTVLEPELPADIVNVDTESADVEKKSEAPEASTPQ